LDTQALRKVVALRCELLLPLLLLLLLRGDEGVDDEALS
jgi:hypothetical protein